MPERKKHKYQGTGSSLPPPSGTDFSVPDGYFDTLPGRIRERITNSKPRQNMVFQMAPKRKFSYAIAASIAIIALVSGLLLIRPPLNDLTLSFYDDALTFDMIHLYAALDPDFIYNIVLDSDLTADEIQFGLTDTEYFNTDNDEIFNYLDNQSEIFWIEDADTDTDIHSN